MKPYNRYICQPCKVAFDSNSSFCPGCGRNTDPYPKKTIGIPILCLIGRHKFRSVMWPVGYAKHPACVGECTRCGQVRDVEATAWGGVELGRWASLAEMRQRIAAGTADEKPDGQAENAKGDAPGANGKPIS